jgi:hypothetical protein
MCVVVGLAFSVFSITALTAGAIGIRCHWYGGSSTSTSGASPARPAWATEKFQLAQRVSQEPLPAQPIPVQPPIQRGGAGAPSTFSEAPMPEADGRRRTAGPDHSVAVDGRPRGSRSRSDTDLSMCTRCDSW